MNAPLHLVQRAADLSAIPVDRFFGNGVVLSIPKKSYEIITAKDLESATPEVQQGDIVVIVTGWHHKYADALEYYGESPGLSKEAAQWLVDKDCTLGPHRGGPLMNRLVDSYQKATGLNPQKEHPEWNIAHRTLLGAEIPTIEQVGGDVDLIAGKRATFVATPWKFEYGDACQVRFVAMMDPGGKCRIDSGKE
jgi:kynurenine formamidase